MSHGILIANGAGQRRLGPEYFIHRLVGSGSVVISAPYATKYVDWPGMSPTDDWFISFGGPAVAAPEWGRFVVKLYDWNYTLLPSATYSVYRR